MLWFRTVPDSRHPLCGFSCVLCTQPSSPVWFFMHTFPAADSCASRWSWSCLTRKPSRRRCSSWRSSRMSSPPTRASCARTGAWQCRHGRVAGVGGEIDPLGYILLDTSSWIHPEICPDIHPVIHPEIRPEKRPEIHYEIHPEAHPELHPVIRVTSAAAVPEQDASRPREPQQVGLPLPSNTVVPIFITEVRHHRGMSS